MMSIVSLSMKERKTSNCCRISEKTFFFYIKGSTHDVLNVEYLELPVIVKFCKLLVTG